MRVMDDLSIGIIYTIKKYSTKEAIIDYLVLYFFIVYIIPILKSFITLIYLLQPFIF